MEIWKTIKGYEGYYEISNLGRIKALERIVDNHSMFLKKIKEKILTNSISKTGYYTTSLSIKAVKKTFKIHRLIAINFIENHNNYPCINHIDGNKLNNDIYNLEWCTIKQNNYHAEINGLKKDYGVNNSRSKLSISDVIFIRKSNLKLKELSNIYKLNESTISKIRLFKTYKKL